MTRALDWFSSSFPGAETALAIGLGMLALAHVLAFYLRLMGFPFRPSARPSAAVIELQIVPGNGMYSVLDESGLAATLRVTRGSGEGEWVADDQHYRIRREGLVKRRFLLELGDVVVARTETARLVGHGLTINYNGRRLTVRPRHFFPLFSSALEVREGTRLVGSFVR